MKAASNRRRFLQRSTANRLTTFATPRNIERVFGPSAMELAVELYWNRLRARRDFTALVSDRCVRRGFTVVDVGASWGLFTYHLSRRVGEQGRLYCFEPHPLNRQSLEGAAELQNNVIFQPIALSTGDGVASLSVPRFHGRLVTAQARLGRGFANVDVEGIQVATQSLDAALPAGTHPDFIKIDVEGHELAVLQGGKKVLETYHPVLMLEIEQRHSPVDIQQVFDYISSIGYEIWALTHDGLCPINLFEVERDQLSLLEDRFYPFDLPTKYISNFLALDPATSLAAGASTGPLGQI